MHLIRSLEAMYDQYSRCLSDPPACPMPRDLIDSNKYAFYTTHTCAHRSMRNKRARVHDFFSHFVSPHWGIARMRQPREI